MTSKTLVCNNNNNTKVGVGSGNEVEVNKFESQKEYS